MVSQVQESRIWWMGLGRIYVIFSTCDTTALALE